MSTGRAFTLCSVVAVALLGLTFEATGADRHGRRAAGPIEAARLFIANFLRGQAKPRQPVVDVVLVDEVPLQAWQGRGAFAAWSAALARGTEDENASSTAPVGPESDKAYVIAPVLYSYEVKGAVVVTPARMAISLRHEATGWKITGWAWAAPNAAEADSRIQFLPQG
jgi:hypothetical protein